MKGTAFFASLAASAAILLPSVSNAEDFVKIYDNASMDAAGVSVSVMHFTPSWTYSSFDSGATLDSGYPKSADGLSEAKGTFKLQGGSVFSFQESLKAGSSPSTLSYSASLKSDSGIESQDIAIEFRLPAATYAGSSLTIDGVQLALPKEQSGDDFMLYTASSFKSISIPSNGASLIIKDCNSGKIVVQDDRKFGIPSLVLRISFSSYEGSVKDSSLSLTFEKGN